MKEGFGIVTCGNCGASIPVFWAGHKYRMPCHICGKPMKIHRQRLKKFEELKK